MQGLMDLHTHTARCQHATGTLEEYVERAQALGIRHFGFSDHSHWMLHSIGKRYAMLASELDDYVADVRRMQEKYNRDGAQAFRVLLGMEMDFIPARLDEARQTIRRYDWDYLIGSVHYLGEKEEFDNPHRMDFWHRTDVEDAWEQYWERFRNMAASGMFHIMGHADLIKKFGFRPSGDLRRYYEPSLEAMRETGACLELNTAGWHNKCGEQYPDGQFLKMAAEAGIPLTISSDAHRPEDVGRDFKRAGELARQAGFRHLASFQGGRMKLFPLPGI